MENQTKSRKNQGDYILQVHTRQKNRAQPKTVCRDSKVYPQVKFLEITFDSQLTFKKHFEDILDPCNTRYHRLRLLANKKREPNPSTLIKIYKQFVRPIFDHYYLGLYHQQNSTAPKQVYSACPSLPKYICTKLLHDSSCLPYVKDRLHSCASKTPDRTAQNPLVEESISSNRLNPRWDRFPTPLSVVRPVSL